MKGSGYNSYLIKEGKNVLIYALRDCAEIDDKVMSFLQPIQMSSLTLVKNLLGAPESVTFPPMLLKVKTPDLPLFWRAILSVMT